MGVLISVDCSCKESGDASEVSCSVQTVVW